MISPASISIKDLLPLYDLSLLKSMSGNDDSFLPMMAKLFVDTAPGILEKMEEALNVADWKLVGTLAHKLKPTIDMMKITSLVQVVRLVELNGKSETELETIPEKVNFILEILRACVENIKLEFGL